MLSEIHLPLSHCARSHFLLWKKRRNLLINTLINLYNFLLWWGLIKLQFLLWCLKVVSFMTLLLQIPLILKIINNLITLNTQISQNTLTLKKFETYLFIFWHNDNDFWVLTLRVLLPANMISTIYQTTSWYAWPSTAKFHKFTLQIIYDGYPCNLMTSELSSWNISDSLDNSTILVWNLQWTHLIDNPIFSIILIIFVVALQRIYGILMI